MTAASQQLFGNCELSLSDFEHGVRHEPRTRLAIQAAVPLGLGLFGVAAFVWSKGHQMTGLGLFALGALVLSVWNMPDVVARRWFNRTKPSARQFRYTVNSTGIIITTSESTRHYPWHGLDAFCEAPDCFLLWLDPRHFLIVPKRAFSVEDQRQIRELMMARVSPYTFLYMPHLRTLGVWLFVAFGVVALLYWGRPR